MNIPPSPPQLRLRVTAAAESALRQGHPWVYGDSIREQNRPGQAGETAVVYDRQDRFLAIGLFDPASPLRVRILHVGKPARLDRDWWTARLRAAISRREGIGIPGTTGYRLVNGESDGWPGLVLDRYDSVLVVKLYTGAWLPRVTELTQWIGEELRPTRLVLRLSRNIQEQANQQGYADGSTLSGLAGEDRVLFQESGLNLEANVAQGQKTGFFLDQRENRRMVEQLSQGAEVLNAFSFSGGFSLYAARGGARRVVDMDISHHALESGTRNFALNQSVPAIRVCVRETISADVFAWLKAPDRRSFDGVVLDPPSLAKREAERRDAIEAYFHLAMEGMRRIRPGGWLLAASCSAHVTAEEFFGAVRSARERSQARFVEIQTTGHAADHPATFPEAQYLKAIYLRRQNVGA